MLLLFFLELNTDGLAFFFFLLLCFFLSLIPLLGIYVVHCLPNMHKALGSKPRWGKNRPEIPALVERLQVQGHFLLQ